LLHRCLQGRAEGAVRVGGKGKSGGSRVVYYGHSDAVTLFLLTAYARGYQEDLRRDMVNHMRALVKAIVDGYRRGSRRVR
jgi:hypothetical protein